MYCVGAVVLFVKYMYVGALFVHCLNDFHCNIKNGNSIISCKPKCIDNLILS